MPKKIKHESFRYAFLLEANKMDLISRDDPEIKWIDFLNNLNFEFIKGEVIVRNNNYKKIEAKFSLSDVFFYKKKRESFRDVNSKNSFKSKNQKYFFNAVLQLAKIANFSRNKPLHIGSE